MLFRSSTLLRCINLLEEPQSGSVIFLGKDYGPATRHSGPPWRHRRDLGFLRTHIGMVFQQFNLFPHLTALENVTLALKRVKKMPEKDAKEKGMRQLATVGLAEKARAYPSTLSGGQQQRVAIARALVMEPRLMMFDEPTSALDPELVGEVLKVLEQLATEGMTLILVTHEMRFAREVGDRIVFMHQGKVWEQGPAKEVFYGPKTPELQQFLGAVTLEEAHHTGKRAEPAPQGPSGIELTHE